MIIQRKLLLYYFSIAALSLLVIQCAGVRKIASEYGNIQILSNELTPQEAESYCRYAASEREKVEAFWGATWKGPIRIHVDSSYQISRALVPAYQGNRGFMEMPFRRAKNEIITGPLLHEIVHIYAPNDNRFLAEGLAVYLHDKMGGNPGFPNFGKSLHTLAHGTFSEVTSLEGLNRVRTPLPLSSAGVDEKTAYIVAGSFVGFLIEKYGLAMFRGLYTAGNFKKIYGKSLSVLENEWRSSVQGK